MRFMPEAAGTICRPCGPVTMASSKAHWPLTTCPRWYLVCNPSSTSTLARPKSASTSMTARPAAAIDTARFVETVVLPTPPLPPVTAITFTGREELSSSSLVACFALNLRSRMGVPAAELACEVCLARRRGALREFTADPHQPCPLQIGGVQVVRHPL